MDLVTLIVVLVVVGLVLWAINAYVPMEPGIKRLLNIAVIIFLILWIVVSFLGYVPNIRIGG